MRIMLHAFPPTQLYGLCARYIYNTTSASNILHEETLQEQTLAETVNHINELSSTKGRMHDTCILIIGVRSVYGVSYISSKNSNSS